MARKNASPDDLLDGGPVGTDELEDQLIIDEDEEIELDAAPEDDLPLGVKIPAKTVDFETTESSTGNKQFKFTFNLLGRDRKFLMWMSLTPQARWVLTKNLKSGWGIVPGEDKKIRVKKAAVLGTFVWLVFESKKYQGEDRIGVKIVTAMTPDEASTYSTEVPE